MKDQDSIQLAHDTLAAIVLQEVPNPFNPESMPTIKAALDVLCWILEHDHNKSFANNLRSIEARLTALGYERRGRERQ